MQMVVADVETEEETGTQNESADEGGSFQRKKLRKSRMEKMKKFGYEQVRYVTHMRRR